MVRDLKVTKKWHPKKSFLPICRRRRARRNSGVNTTSDKITPFPGNDASQGIKTIIVKSSKTDMYYIQNIALLTSH